MTIYLLRKRACGCIVGAFELTASAESVVAAARYANEGYIVEPSDWTRIDRKRFVKCPHKGVGVQNALPGWEPLTGRKAKHHARR